MKRLLLLGIIAAVTISSPAPARGEGWFWNPLKSLPSLTPPAWLTKPAVATGSAVKRTTTGTWKAVSAGTSSAFRKTASLLDPYPNDQPVKAASSSDSGFGYTRTDKPSTPSEFFELERP